jgi:hypothetical protein
VKVESWEPLLVDSKAVCSVMRMADTWATRLVVGSAVDWAAQWAAMRVVSKGSHSAVRKEYQWVDCWVEKTVGS